MILGIYNVYSFYDGKDKEKWLNSIDDENIKQIAVSEFLYYEGKITESYQLLNNIINDATKEKNYNTLIGASSLLCRVSLVMNDYDVWQKGISILFNCRDKNPLLCDFMISCVYCSIDSYEFAIDFIKNNSDVPKSYKPQYNYLLMATDYINLSKAIDDIINKNESIVCLIQAYLLKAITSDIDETKVEYIQKAFDISITNGFIMPLVEMGMPLNRYYSSKYIKGYSNELREIKKLCKSYASGITKVYIDSDKNELTLKEFTALFFMSQGKKNKEIASMMNISENTLKYYLKLAFEKTKIKKRKQIYQIIVKFDKNIKMGGKN